MSGNPIFLWKTNFLYAVQFWEGKVGLNFPFFLIKQYVGYPFFSDLLTLIALQIASVPSTYQKSLVVSNTNAETSFFFPGKFCNAIGAITTGAWKFEDNKTQQLKIAFYFIEMWY